MKIKTINKTYDEVMALPKPKRKKPLKPLLFWRCLVWLLSLPAILKARFTYTGEMPKGPCMILMNHSCFMDMKIAYRILFPRPFCIVSTSDGMIGKRWLMRQIGCIPTRKFVSDTALVRNIRHALKNQGSNVVMFPEAGYSFDGRSTVLPDSLGRCVKMMGVPLVMIRTFGAFTRDPLYNNLQRRRVKVGARVEYLLSPEQIAEMTDGEINDVIRAQFAFDSFMWQKENEIRVTEDFRADGLNRILYKCPDCLAEGKTEGRGTQIKCHACGRTHTLSELGTLEAEGGAKFDHVPDWYDWERECVRREVESGEYRLDIPVDILVSVDTKRLYSVGKGRLVHSKEGFTLVGEDGLSYSQKALASYSLNSDFNWYEIGDMISIGDNKVLYYCFPEVEGDVVAKARLAQEEAYKLALEARLAPTV